MKFAKLFMAIAVVCLAVACANPEKQVEKAQKHADKKEWVKAAEAIAKIDPADMAKEAKVHNKIAEVTTTILFMSNDKEAVKIIEEWNEKVNDEYEKLEKKEKK